MFTGFNIFLDVLLVLSIIGKSYLHSHIAYRNNVKLKTVRGFQYETLWYFTEPVRNDCESSKKICNRLQSCNIVLLLLRLVIGIFT